MIATLWWRSHCRLAAAVGAMAALADLLLNRAWVGEWQGGVQAATDALVFLMAPLILAAAADSRALLRRPLVAWARSRRVRCLRLAAVVGVSWAWAALACVVVLATSMAVNAATSSYDDPGLVPLLVPLVWAGLYAGLGVVLGRFVGLVLVAPVAVLAGYVAQVVVAYRPDVRPALLTLLDNGAVSPPIFLRTGTLLAQAAIFALLGLASLVPVLVSMGPRERREVTVAACVGGAALAAVGLLVAAGPHVRRYQAQDASGPRRCSRPTAPVCVWPDHTRLLGPALRAARRLDAALTGVGVRPPAGYAEDGLARPTTWATFATGTASASPSTVAQALVGGALASSWCGAARLHGDASLVDREQYLLVRAGYAPRDAAPSSVSRVLALGPSRRAVWFGSPRGGVTCS